MLASMAKPRHDQTPTSSNTTLAILVAGGVLVAALVVWALTRTVEPAATVDTTTFATTTTPAADQGFLATDTVSTSVTSPIASTATSIVPPPPAGDKGAVTRIAAEDLRAQMGRGEVTVIDVRDPAAFAREHIPGALNMPLATVEGQIDMLPKGKAIVTYCT